MIIDTILPENTSVASASPTVEPLLYGLRKYPDGVADGSTTSCQSTSNPSDYSPDD